MLSGARKQQSAGYGYKPSMDRPIPIEPVVISPIQEIKLS
jgi:hypothetical protein